MQNSLNSEDRMHGSIFVLLKKFVEANYDYSTWLKLLADTRITHHTYELNEMYPTWEVKELLIAAVKLTGISQDLLLEKFGQFLVPDLLLLYKKYINPDWKTFDMLLNTETVMHGAVRQQDARTNPPILFVSKVNNNLLIIDYYSKRRMGSLAVGIIKGIAAHYRESDRIRITPATNMYAERVQLKVAYI